MPTSANAQAIFLTGISSTIWTSNIAFHKLHVLVGDKQEKGKEIKTYPVLGLVVTGVMMTGLVIRMLHARQHFVINLMFAILNGIFLWAISRMLALHAEIGYPIFACIAVGVVIAARFERFHNCYLAFNGPEAVAVAAAVEASKKEVLDKLIALAVKNYMEKDDVVESEV